MVKRGIMLLVLLTCALGLCACSNEQVSISEENEKKVVGYASNVLVEHDANHEDSIRNFSEKELNRIVKLDLLAAVEQAGLNEEPTEEEETTEENGESSSGSSGEGSQDAEEPTKTIAEALGLTDFDVS